MEHQLNTGFSGLSDPDFQIKAESIYNSMLENEFFSAPIPAITEIESAVNTFKDTLLAAQSEAKTKWRLKTLHGRPLPGRSNNWRIPSWLLLTGILLC